MGGKEKKISGTEGKPSSGKINKKWASRGGKDEASGHLSLGLPTGTLKCWPFSPSNFSNGIYNHEGCAKRGKALTFQKIHIFPNH